MDHGYGREGFQRDRQFHGVLTHTLFLSEPNQIQLETMAHGTTFPLGEASESTRCGWIDLAAVLVESAGRISISKYGEPKNWHTATIILPSGYRSHRTRRFLTQLLHSLVGKHLSRARGSGRGWDMLLGIGG